MKLYKSIFLIIAALALVIMLTLKIYYSSEEPSYSGKMGLLGIVDTVEIYTDEYGQSNVYAKSNEDLFYTAGFLVARERLFQLSIINAVVNGNIADILGEEYLSHDQYIKATNRFGNIDLTAIRESSLELLGSYCDGINNYIKNNSTELPISYKLTGSQPQEWTVRDAIATLMLMTYNNLTERSGAVIQTAINKYFGESRSIYVKPLTNTIDSTTTAEELQLEYEILELIGANGSSVGSVASVVSPERSKSGKPIIVFSDVWGYRHPTKWFDISLNGGDYNVSGSCIVGFPLPLVGSNDQFAFAFTNKLTELTIDDKFELAKLNPRENIQDQNIQNLCWADTAGNYFNDSNNGGYLEEIDKESELEFAEISKLLHSSKNENKANQINIILDHYNSDKKVEIDKIRNWDGNESDTSSTALLANTILKNLIEGIFKDELTLIGEDIYELFIRNTKLVGETLERVITTAESAWLDNINTINYTENFSDVIEEAVDRSIVEIRSKYGNTNHAWGKVNPPKFEHILDERKVAQVFANFNTSTLSRKSVQEFFYNDDLSPVSTVVLTKIFDLSEPGAYYSRLLPGQSGIPSNPHYSDQLDLYNRESLRRVVTNEETIKNSNTFKRLVLYPPK